MIGKRRSKYETHNTTTLETGTDGEDMYRIILVDRDATSLAIVRALLEDEYDIVLARSSLQALGSLNAMMKENRLPDLMILELFIPGMDGIELLEELKQDERLSKIAPIFLTNESSTSWKLKCFNAGAVDYLEKPPNGDLLKLKVRRQLRLLELERENQKMRNSLITLRNQFYQLFPEQTGPGLKM